MASLSSVSCQRVGSAGSGSFVESLPHDVFSNVFGCLNRDEQLNASLVSKSFNQRIIDFPLAKLSLLAQLTQSLVDRLGQDRFSGEIGILQGIYERAIPKMDVGNLRALQNRYRALKEQLIGVMKTFDEETLLSLKGAISPRLMNPFLKEGDSLQPRGGKCLAAHQLDSSANSAVNGRDCASSELFTLVSEPKNHYLLLTLVPIDWSVAQPLLGKQLKPPQGLRQRGLCPPRFGVASI